ncbi:MAG: DsrE family protein [Enterobacterales bacterium]|nr:DsrE family protein [Enterobacterales bacterium]
MSSFVDKNYLNKYQETSLKIINLLLLFFLLIISNLNAQPSSAQQPTKGPIFTDYGPVFKVPDSDVVLIPNFKYKVFFDIGQTTKETFNLNHRIESIARFINMHALNGVKLKDMQIAVVLHGAATRDLLTNASYQKRYDNDNPTAELVKQLLERDVKFYLCGQSLYFMKLNKKDLIPGVKVALSAMTISTMLQAEGYTLIP